MRCSDFLGSMFKVSADSYKTKKNQIEPLEGNFIVLLWAIFFLFSTIPEISVVFQKTKVNKEKKIH